MSGKISTAVPITLSNHSYNPRNWSLVRNRKGETTHTVKYIVGVVLV